MLLGMKAIQMTNNFNEDFEEEKKTINNIQKKNNEIKYFQILISANETVT